MSFFGLVNIMGLIDLIAAFMLFNSSGSFASLIATCLLIKGVISIISVEY